MKFTEATATAFAMKRNVIDNAIGANVARENLKVTVRAKRVRVVNFSSAAVCPAPTQTKEKIGCVGSPRRRRRLGGEDLFPNEATKQDDHRKRKKY